MFAAAVRIILHHFRCNWLELELMNAQLLYGFSGRLLRALEAEQQSKSFDDDLWMLEKLQGKSHVR